MAQRLRAETVKNATIKDVAKVAGVSATTVSFVLNRQGSISAEVRERVLAAVESVRYRPNRQATAMRTGRSQTIGLVLPDLRNPFFPDLADAISEAAMEADHIVLLGGGSSIEREHESLVRLAAQGVDGICWCPASGFDTPRALGITLPIVVIDRPLPGYDTVTSDFKMAGTLLAEEVVRAKLSRVGLITGPPDLPGTTERTEAFVDAVSNRAEIVWRTSNPYSLTLEAEVERLLAERSADAVLCGNDMIAIGTLRRLKMLGCAVPEDVAVFGFDDIAWAHIVEPPLTTVRQKLNEIGTMAIGLLLSRMTMPDLPTRHALIDVEIRCRASTLSRAEQPVHLGE